MLKNYSQWEKNVLAYRTSKARAKPDCIDYIPNTWDTVMALHAPDHKRRHYWIYSTCPDKGKTTFLEKLDNDYRCSWYNKSEVY